MNQVTNLMTLNDNKPVTRTEIRQFVRRQRKALSIATQKSCSQKLSNVLQQRLSNLIKQQSLEPSQPKKYINIALYLANDGEIDPQLFINWCWKTYNTNRIRIYLPVIHPFSEGNLLFLRYDMNTFMVKNKFGILEPKLNVLEICPVNDLHILFTPLVAFDHKGNRLGMGGGFYDRTLSNIEYLREGFTTKENNSSYKNTYKTHIKHITQVIGLAHECQEIKQLPVEAWDMPLPEIITPKKTFISTHSSSNNIKR